MTAEADGVGGGGGRRMVIKNSSAPEFLAVLVARTIFKYFLVFATLLCVATQPTFAQDGSTAQGGGSFMVQFPQYTPLHPAPAMAPSTYPAPITSAQDRTQNYV